MVEPPVSDRRILRAVLDQAGVAGEPLSERRLAGGETSVVLAVRVSGSPEMVVKLYSHDLAWKREKEVYVYGLLGALPDVPVPSVLASGAVDGETPISFLVLTKIDGEIAAGVLPGLAASGVEAVYEEIGSVLRRIHSVTFESFGNLFTSVLDLAKTDYYAVRGDGDKRRGLYTGYGPLPTGWEDALPLYVVYHVLELWDWFATNGDIERAASVLADLERLAS